MSYPELLASGFEELIADYHWPDLQNRFDTTVGLWPDLTIGYVNPAWFRFARENGGGEYTLPSLLGQPYLGATASPLRKFYEHHLTQSFETATVWQHQYECSSPAQYRRYLETCYPLKGGQGLLLVHSLVQERQHEHTNFEAVDETYRNADGLIRQCAHCRRTEFIQTSGRWDFVPEWIKNPPSRVSHVICEDCRQHYYPPVPDESVSH